MAYPCPFDNRFRHLRHSLTETRRRVEDIPFERVRFLDDPLRPIGIPLVFGRRDRRVVHHQRHAFPPLGGDRSFLRLIRGLPAKKPRIPVPFGICLRLRPRVRHPRTRIRRGEIRARHRVFGIRRRIRRSYEDPPAPRIPLRRGVRLSGAFVLRGHRDIPLRTLPVNRRVRPHPRVRRFRVPVLPPRQIRELSLACERVGTFVVPVFPCVLSGRGGRFLSVFPLRIRLSSRRARFCQMENVPSFRSAFPFLIGDIARVLVFRGVFLPFFLVFGPRNIPFVPRVLGSVVRELSLTPEIISDIRLAHNSLLRI